jgi:hypothetical protein
LLQFGWGLGLSWEAGWMKREEEVGSKVVRMRGARCEVDTCNQSSYSDGVVVTFWILIDYRSYDLHLI